MCRGLRPSAARGFFFGEPRCRCTAANSSSSWPPPRLPAWRWIAARCSPARAAKLYDVPRFGNVQSAAFHRLPRATAADLFPRAQRQPGHRRGARQGRRTWSASTCSRPSAFSRAAAEAHAFTYLDFEQAANLRQGRRLRPSRHAGEDAAGRAARRAAARRRRHLAGFGDRAVDQGPGHGRRLQAARRGRDDRSLGVHLRRRAGQGDRRQGLQGQDRVRRPERQDHRLRATRCSSRTSCARSTASGGDHRPGVSVHARSPIRATWSPTGPSASRTTRCRRWSTRRAARAHRSSCCCRTTAWTSI